MNDVTSQQGRIKSVDRDMAPKTPETGNTPIHIVVPKIQNYATFNNNSF